MSDTSAVPATKGIASFDLGNKKRTSYGINVIRACASDDDATNKSSGNCDIHDKSGRAGNIWKIAGAMTTTSSSQVDDHIVVVAPALAAVISLPAALVAGVSAATAVVV